MFVGMRDSSIRTDKGTGEAAETMAEHFGNNMKV